MHCCASFLDRYVSQFHHIGKGVTTGIEPCPPGSQPGALPISYSHSFASWIRTTISAFKAPRPAVRRRQKESGRLDSNQRLRASRARRTARTSQELRSSLRTSLGRRSSPQLVRSLRALGNVRNLRFARLPLLPEKKKPRQIARAVMISFRSCYCQSKSNIRTRPNSPSRGCRSRC